MRPKAPIYTTENAAPFAGRIKDLWALCKQFEGHPLYNELVRAIAAVEAASKATQPIQSHDRCVGYGLDKATKDIACDTAMSILRQIRSAKGW